MRGCDSWEATGQRRGQEKRGAEKKKKRRGEEKRRVIKYNDISSNLNEPCARPIGLI